MENVIATVSGYHGSERFNLIKLISHSGASYVGAMSRSITHLICWKFEGKKYSLAKKLNTVIVNHQWLEECIKQGRRVSESSYMSKSGAEVGPFLMEVPLVSKVSESIVKQKASSKKVDLFCTSSKGSRYLGASEIDTWTESSLLKEINGESHFRNHRSGKKKRNNLVNGIEDSCLPESSRKSRRLVKKNVGKTIVDLDSDQDCQTNSSKVLCQKQTRARNSERSLTERGVRIAESGETSIHHHLRAHSRKPSNGLDDIEESDTWNHSFGIGVPHTPYVNRLDTVASSSQDNGSDDKSSKEKDVEANETVASLPPTAMLSCVICFTDFSSIRGILPCGHRFCYSCIQSWADKLASQRKNSTCPLCKASFDTITKVEEAGSSDQKIYSQSIPCPSSVKDILIIENQERSNSASQNLPSVCSRCRFREPEELLVSCSICSFRCIHSYCMDPYLLPWTCIHCKDMQHMMLYRHPH